MSFMPTSPASTSICCQGLNGKRTTTKPCIPKIWCTLYGTKYIWLYWVVKMYFLTLFSSIQSTSFINLHNTHIILDHLSLMFLKVYLSCRSHEEGYKTWFLLVVRSGCSWKYCWALNQIWFRYAYLFLFHDSPASLQQLHTINFDSESKKGLVLFLYSTIVLCNNFKVQKVILHVKFVELPSVVWWHVSVFTMTSAWSGTCKLL